MEAARAAPPASALRLRFREVSDRALVKMVCFARAISLMWMILRVSRRREAESLYDRARYGWSALVVDAVRRVRSGVVERVGRVRVFRRPRGAYTQRASRLRRESLATPPYGRLHTLALPPISHARVRRARATDLEPLARCNGPRRSPGHSRARPDRRRRSGALRDGAVKTTRADESLARWQNVRPAGREGVSVPRGGALCRSERLARSARLAACKAVRDDEWNARDRPLEISNDEPVKRSRRGARPNYAASTST